MYVFKIGTNSLSGGKMHSDDIVQRLEQLLLGHSNFGYELISYLIIYVIKCLYDLFSLIFFNFFNAFVLMHILDYN